MHPRLLVTPFFTVYTFGLLLASAYVAAFWWLMREGRRARLDVDALGALGFWAIAGAIIGAKVLMVLRDLPDYVATWSVTFTDPVAARIGGTPLGVPLHPVQLYESLVCVVLFVVLLRVRRRQRFDAK